MSNIRPGVLGKYNLQERLGQGGMAEVWKAFDERLQRFVAIKFLHGNLQDDTTFLTRFVREARAVASLRHPNIVQVYDFETTEPGTDQPPAYMVMDYVEGTTLSEYLSATSRIQKFPSSTDIVPLFFAICEAVDYAHQHGVLHRDIKPANILLDQRHTTRNSMGEPILTDFGIAKILGSTDGTLTSALIGTPLYISPEQAQAQNISAASDIYSLSVVLYEIYTGRPPFLADNPLAVLQQHITAQPVSPDLLNPLVSPALAAVIVRGLAKAPEDRYPSARALAEALSEALVISLPTNSYQPLSSPDLRVSSEISELPTHLLDSHTEIASANPVSSVAKTPLTPSPVRDTPAGNLDNLSTYVAEPLSPVKRPTEPPLAVTPPLIEVPRPASRRPRGLLVAVIILLLVVLAGSGLAAFLHFRPTTTASATPTPAVTSNAVGSAFFTSSGASFGANNMGLNDTFQVHLTNIPQPAAGTQYYAWLLPDTVQSEADSRAVGILAVTGGVASLPRAYVDTQHENLIAHFSRFLVTEEATSPVPQNPSLDTHLWRYYAEIPQTPPSTDCQGVLNQLSGLCHLRHLLSGDPELAKVNLNGGLNYWFLTNAQSVQHWGTEAVSHTDAPTVRHKIVDILYLLDGNGCIAQDIQQNAPNLENIPDAGNLGTIAAIPLLDCALTPDTPGYLTHIHNHLNAMIQSPGILQSQKTLGSQIATELNAINGWLKELQSDAQKLLAMNDDQLMGTQGLSLRNGLSAQANNVLSGSNDPGTGMLQQGISAISAQVQQLATMNVTIYSSK